MNLLQRLKAHLPTPEDLQRQRWLRPYAHRLSDAALWHPHTEAVARGVAVGLFWAFAVPVAQTLFAAAHCAWWRGNIPVAAAVTMITNPFTVGGWLWLAYKLGELLVGPSLSGGTGWMSSVGWPTLLGMALFAVGGALIGYALVHGGARLWSKWRAVSADAS